MNNDLLPEWLNLFLDDVETSLCLPILLVIVLCTAQFIYNHAVDIGYTFYQNMKQKSCEGGEDDEDKEKGEGIMDRIKGYICKLGLGTNNSTVDKKDSTATTPLRPNSQEDDWFYCEEDDE